MKQLLLAACLSLAFAIPAAHAQDVTNTGWEIPPQFEHDTFTFVRLRPQLHSKWTVDYPDSDLNFPFRLQQLTSIKVNPTSRVLDITSPELKDYPFTYIVEPGALHLTDQEAEILRKYLLNGGFLMFDDFWGEAEWATVYENVKRIFPNREPVELELDHEIFHVMFDIKEKPQIPALSVAQMNRNTGRFYENGAVGGAHFYGVFDDENRMMMIICRDTDLGDSWETEGDDPWFFKEFSEKRGYPMGFNIIFYMMTH